MMTIINRLQPFRAPIFPGYYFNEFPVASSIPWKAVQEHLSRSDIVGGLDLSDQFPELGSSALIAVTDRHKSRDLERLAHAMEGLA